MPGLGIDSLDHLRSICKQPLTTLWAIADEPGPHYGSFTIPKSAGRFRLITPPKGDLMRTQRQLLTFLTTQKKWGPWVHGGVRGRSIFTNAQPHVGRAMVANLDVRDFFPTTTMIGVQHALERNHLPPDVARLLAALTTYSPARGDRCLPQGSPTSTFLANLVFEQADDRFVRLSKGHNLRYTRYVDDVTISGGRDFRDLKGALVEVVTDVGYSLSTDKVWFRGRSKRQIVTGLVVNDKLRPTKEFIFALKRLIRQCFWPGEVGIEIAAAEQGLTVRQLRSTIEGRINHLRKFDKRKAREVKALIYRQEA